MKNPIIVIAGPTASGKTAMAVELAKKFDGEIINADSRSIYIGMDIGTGKPEFDKSRITNQKSENNEINSKFEIQNSKFFQGIPHHLFDLITPDQTFSFVEYKKLANLKIKEIQERGKIPILVGGTGLYLDSVIYDYKPAGEADWDLRKTLEEKDPELLYGMLALFDPETAKTIDPKNKRRVIRALEIFEQTRKGKVEQEEKKEKPGNVLYLALDISRDALYEKINKRVDEWMKEGFEDEVKNLLKTYSFDAPGMNAIGYRDIASHINDEISKEDAIEKTKQGNRNYAKRQLTWLKRNKDIIWIKNTEEAEKFISKFLKN